MRQENRRPPLVVVPRLRVAHVDARDFIRPRGAPALYPPLALVEDAEPQDKGDALALDDVQHAVNYEAPWRRYLASDSLGGAA